MSNHYQNFQEASDSNWELLVEMFGKSEKFKLIKPHRIDSGWDGMLVADKNGKQHVILCEVKRRQFDRMTLENEYFNTFYLEKDKYKTLHDRKKKLEAVDKTRNVKIWYISKTSDGYCYIFDITNRDYAWFNKEMNKVTYTPTQVKVAKMITLLPVSDAFFAKNIKILN